MRFCYRNRQSRADRGQSAGERTSGRSCSHGVGERERERLRIVRKEGKYRSISIFEGTQQSLDTEYRELV